MCVKGESTGRAPVVGPCCADCLVPDQPLGVCKGPFCDPKYNGYHLLCTTHSMSWCALRHLVGAKSRKCRACLLKCHSCHKPLAKAPEVPLREFRVVKCVTCENVVHRLCARSHTNKYGESHDCGRCTRKSLSRYGTLLWSDSDVPDTP